MPLLMDVLHFDITCLHVFLFLEQFLSFIFNLLQLLVLLCKLLLLFNLQTLKAIVVTSFCCVRVSLLFYLLLNTTPVLL